MSQLAIDILDDALAYSPHLRDDCFATNASACRCGLNLARGVLAAARLHAKEEPPASPSEPVITNCEEALAWIFDNLAQIRTRLEEDQNLATIAKAVGFSASALEQRSVELAMEVSGPSLAAKPHAG